MLAELAQLGAVVQQHLAAQQVERLDGVGAFVDHVDPRVADVLLHAPFADVAVAAEDLHRQVGGGEAVVGDEGLDHRRQQREQVVALPCARPRRDGSSARSACSAEPVARRRGSLRRRPSASAACGARRGAR